MRATKTTRAGAKSVLALACAFSATAFAQTETAPAGSRPEPEFALNFGVGQTDNLGRDPVPIRSDIRSLGARFDFRTLSRRLRGSLFGNLERREYGGAGLADDEEVAGSADGALALHAVPERFIWNFEQNFGQSRLDPLAADSPDNREKTTVFSTGPELNFPLPGRNALEVGGRVSERRFESTNQLDSRFTTARLGLSHELSEIASIGLELNKSKNEFENTLIEYEFRIVSIVYAKQLATGSVEMSVGRGETRIAAQSDSTSTARFGWSREVGARSRLSVWASKELTDAGELFRSTGVPGGEQSVVSGLTSVFDIHDGRMRNVVSGSPLRRSTAGSRFEVAGQEMTARFSLIVSEDRFEVDETLDNDSDVFQFDFTRSLGRRWGAGAGVLLWRQTFTVLDENAEDRSTYVEVSRSLGRRVDVTGRVTRSLRDSVLDGYDENSYLVSLTYDFVR